MFRRMLGATESPEQSTVLMNSLEEVVAQLATEFNQKVDDTSLQIKVQRRPADKAGEYMRMVAYSPFWTMSVRGKGGKLEVFLVPTTEIHSLAASEVASNLKLRLDYDANAEDHWATNGIPVTDKEVVTLVRSLFKDLVTKSKGDMELIPEALRMPLGPDGQSLAGSVRDLINQKHLLTQKIINQQEQLQFSWARDIHDAVIGNVMALKRAVASNKPLDKAEIERMLDEINDQLRNICYELAPRDLKDCGLQVVLEGLIDQLEERVSAECILDFPEEIPNLPDEVQLHIFRIVQECFNNIVKHADADHVYLRVSSQDGQLRVAVEDDGKGFDVADTSPKLGMGSSTLRERTALINQFFPASITIDSTADKGTKVTLRIDLDK